MIHPAHSRPVSVFGTIRPISLVFTALVLSSLSACNRSGSTSDGQRMRVSVGEIKEVSLSSRAQLVATSDNQEVVDVSQRTFTSADSSAMQRGQSVSTVFLVKGVSTGTARVILSEKTTGEAGPGRTRKTYTVQVVSE